MPQVRDSWSLPHAVFPLLSRTNTTGEIGQKVAVPDRSTTNGAWCAATVCRWCSTRARSSAWTSVGGTKVMCGGTDCASGSPASTRRSEEHTSELQSRFDLVCRLLLE